MQHFTTPNTVNSLVENRFPRETCDGLESVVIDRRQLAQRVSQEFLKHGESRPMQFDAERFVIKIGESRSGSVVINLHNLYNEIENSPAEHHDEIITHYVKGWIAPRDIPNDYSVAQPRLGVSVQYAGVVEQFPEWVHRDLASDLCVLLVDDDGDTLAYVLEESVRKWQVSLEACIGDAIRNLKKSPWPLEQIGHMFYSRAHDSYDAARILLPEVIRQLPLKGEPVVLLPDRECLVITGSDDVDGLTQLAAMGHVRFEEASRHISAVPLILKDGAWKAFVPPEPTRATFAHLARLYDVIHHGAHTSLLREKYKAQTQDVYLAEIRVFKTADERYETFTCLPSNGPTLLPKADRVVLYDLQAGAVQVTAWADLFRVLGGEMSRVGQHPVRYHVARFPSLAERQQMGGTTQRMDAHLPTRLRMRPR
jgi:uncharacterized protein YtpQ (UPF0354 family)